MIYGVPLVGFRRAKNKSSSHLRGVVRVPRKGDFAEDPRREILGNRNFQV